MAELLIEPRHQPTKTLSSLPCVARARSSNLCIFYASQCDFTGGQQRKNGKCDIPKWEFWLVSWHQFDFFLQEHGPLFTQWMSSLHKERTNSKKLETYRLRNCLFIVVLLSPTPKTRITGRYGARTVSLAACGCWRFVLTVFTKKAPAVFGNNPQSSVD
jgi:hypothetical protein